MCDIIHYFKEQQQNDILGPKRILNIGRRTQEVKRASEEMKGHFNVCDTLKSEA